MSDAEMSGKSATPTANTVAVPAQNKGKTNPYVNDLQEQVASDEDEDGYTVYDPRHQPDGAEYSQEEGDIYENSPALETEARGMRKGSGSATQGGEVMGGITEAPTTRRKSEQRAYVNDLDHLANEAKTQLEASQLEAPQLDAEPRKPHHPYVNDISILVRQAGLKERDDCGQEERGGGGEGEKEGESPPPPPPEEGDTKKKPHYVNDLASLLPHT